MNFRLYSTGVFSIMNFRLYSTGGLLLLEGLLLCGKGFTWFKTCQKDAWFMFHESRNYNLCIDQLVNHWWRLTANCERRSAWSILYYCKHTLMT
jgi:hypothetical protein